MKQTALQYFNHFDLSLLALILFFVSFLFLIYRVYFFETNETMDKLAEIPLCEEASHER